MSRFTLSTIAVFSFATFAALSASATTSVRSSARSDVGATAHGAQDTRVADCQGCKHTASAAKVVDVESTYYKPEHIDSKFSTKLRECYKRAGWHADEKQLDYLVAYKAEEGKVTSVKGSMFGKQANPDLLACIDHELTGVDIGKVRKDPEVHGFAMTVRVEE